MATWRTIELQLCASHERGVKQMKSNKIEEAGGKFRPVAIRASSRRSDARVLAIGGKVIGRTKIKRVETDELSVTVCT